jgi:hypothetical protein
MKTKKELTPEQKLAKLAYNRKWRKENPEKTAEHSKRSRIKNQEKIRKYKKEWEIKNKPRLQEKSKEWYNKNAMRVKNTRLIYKFGITLDEYNELLNKQKNSCSICGNPPRLQKFAVDHDHKTGKVRGLLCRDCNVGIGNLKDDPDLIEKAIQYIKKFREN